MKTIEDMTIIERAAYLWNAPADWSMSGGLIWLTFAMSVVAVAMVAFSIAESRRERRAEIYRAARVAALARKAAWDANGYQEIIVYNSNR